MKIELFRHDFPYCHVSIRDFSGGVCERYQIKGMEKGDELTILIGYPLSNPFILKATWKENRFDLCEQVCNAYRQIYKEEEETSEKAPARICDDNPNCSLINRNKTNGKYGIWGHDIGDLVIEQIVIDTELKTADIHIGS